jgi:hypothetical protein
MSRLRFCQAARDAGIARSMGSVGDCYDNAVAEGFFATLNKELVHRRSWPTRRELATEVFDYIEAFYNRIRRHSTLGVLAPLKFENRRTGGTPPPGREVRERLVFEVADRELDDGVLAMLDDQAPQSPPSPSWLQLSRGPVRATTSRYSYRYSAGPPGGPLFARVANSRKS